MGIEFDFSKLDAIQPHSFIPATPRRTKVAGISESKTLT
jgi:hypothetical protein